MGETAGGNDKPHAGGAPSRRLAAIMFTDLVGYSALAHRDEKLAIELLELHRGWIREILPRHDGIEIETVGDAFLIEFAGALAAVECAVAIQGRFAEHNKAAPVDRRMQLRIGVHLGDIEHKDGKVMGDGVNIASRIHGMAEPGGICVSETVHQVIHHRGFSFEALGAPALKNIDTRVQLYALNAAPRRGIARIGATLRRARVVTVAVAAVVILAAVTASIWRAGGLEPTPAPAKSVAVLPFANLSAEKDSEYFADGVHDAVITHLARVRDLKTISRTSVMEYRDAKRNLRNIGHALGAAHVVEGSVQRSGNRVRITAQLISVANDQHVWAESYDREVDDVFAIQSEIAAKVAAHVQTTLSEIQLQQMGQRPTRSPEAYDLYLKALDRLRRIQDGSDLINVQRLFERAVTLDPDFAAAHAMLGWCYLNQFLGARHGAGDLLGRAKAAIDRSLEIDPDLPEGRSRLALYYYWGFRDYERALRENARALAVRPNDAPYIEIAGLIQRRQGLWQESIANLQRVTELDPLADNTWRQLFMSYRMMRRYEDAARTLQQMRQFTLTFESKIAAAEFLADWKGDLSDLRALVRETQGNVDPDGRSAWVAAQLARYEGRHADAADLLAGAPQPQGGRELKELFVGRELLAAGKHAEARAAFLEGARKLGDHIAAEPGAFDASSDRAALAVAHAYLGDREAAERTMAEASALMPVERDAMKGADVMTYKAEMHAQLGQIDAAVAALSLLLRIPADLVPRSLTVDVRWRPLREDLRFRKLIAEHLPKDGGT